MKKIQGQYKEQNEARQIYLTAERGTAESSTRARDADIWQAFKNGSSIALKLIYDSNIEILYNYGANLVFDKEGVKDCIHDLFIEIWNKRKNLGEIRSIRSYLIVSLRRRILSKSIKQNRFQSIDEEESFDFQLSPVFQQLTDGNSDLQETITKKLKHLPERQKEALYLRFYNQLSCEEIAEIMEISVQSVYNHIHRALKILRVNLLTHFSDRRKS